MPDISMCDDQTCPIKVTCFRSEASGTVPDEYQWWANWQSHPDTGECDGYWPLSTSAPTVSPENKNNEF